MVAVAPQTANNRGVNRDLREARMLVEEENIDYGEVVILLIGNSYLPR